MGRRKAAQENLIDEWVRIYPILFRSKYLVKGLLALYSNNGKLERPRLRELVNCSDLNKYIMIPLLDEELIIVYTDKKKYPYKHYVELTEEGKFIANELTKLLRNIGKIL